jgi:hypothetical protein
VSLIDIVDLYQKSENSRGGGVSLFLSLLVSPPGGTSPLHLAWILLAPDSHPPPMSFVVMRIATRFSSFPIWTAAHVKSPPNTCNVGWRCGRRVRLLKRGYPGAYKVAQPTGGFFLYQGFWQAGRRHRGGGQKVRSWLTFVLQQYRVPRRACAPVLNPSLNRGYYLWLGCALRRYVGGAGHGAYRCLCRGGSSALVCVLCVLCHMCTL